MKELSLYIHIPFCNKSKCSYCSFVSFCDKEEKIDEYIFALSKEMEMYKKECQDYLVKTIFIGGGTPSVLSPAQISLLFGYIRNSFTISENVEITIECNIDTLSEEKLLTYKSLGVNRISIGAQSMNDEVLGEIGRRHSSGDVVSAVKLIKKIGFKSFNVDMMVGLPQQTLQDVRQMTNFLISQNVPHISCYSLMLEEGTPLFEKVKVSQVSLPTEDDTVKMYDEVFALLSHNGYSRYEVSNFAKDGFECQHNLCYWLGKEYIGLGVSSHSYAKDKRFCNSEKLDDYFGYINSGEKPIIYEEILSLPQQREEYIMLRLRTKYGINLKYFEQKFGENLLKTREKEIIFLKNNNLIEINDNILKIKDSAFYVMNSIIVKLI